MKTVKVYGAYAPMLKWLSDNIGIGAELHSMPIVFWYGKGWFMKRTSDIREERVGLRAGWSVDFDDDQNATWFALIWG